VSMPLLDLNKLRDTMHSNQQEGSNLPSDPSKQVAVDKEGNVYVGAQNHPGQALTQAPQGTFQA